MLHRLPNEMLLKILEKTKSTTSKECRLLNSQFDSLIQRFQLHLQNIDFLIIRKSYNKEEYTFFQARDSEWPYHKHLTYNTYEEMLTGLNIQLKKVRSVKRIEFLGFSINEDLIRVFNNQRWLRKLDELVMDHCIFDRNAVPYWFSFLSKLRLNVLRIENLLPYTSKESEKMLMFPKTILNNVRSEFVYRGDYTGDVIEMPCLDDSLLENYIDSGKTIQVHKAFTSYTFGGVQEFLKNVSKSNRIVSWNSGIMKNVTAYDMDNLLKELKAEYHQYDEPQEQCTSFWVTKLGAKQDIYIQTCEIVAID